MLAPSKEPPCQVQGYRTPLAGVNRSRTRQTPVNQDGSCAMRAGGRRLHSQGTTAAGVGKPARDPRGSRGISQWQKFPQQHWEGAGTRAVSAKEQHGTAGSALVSEPAARHGMAQHGVQEQCQAACTAPAWHTLHGPPRSNCAAQLGTTGATCLQLGWLCHGAPQTPGNSSANARRGAGHPSAKQGGHPRGHGRSEEQLNGPRPHGACGNRHRRTLPKHLLPPRWHGASARSGHGSGGGGGGEHARARSKKRHVCAWQHNREQVTSAPAVALLQEASTQASDAALPGEKIKHPPPLPLTIPPRAPEKGPRRRGVGALLQNDGPVASRLSLPPPASLPRPRKSQGSQIMCVCVHKHFSSANTPRDNKISRPCTRSRAAPLL